MMQRQANQTLFQQASSVGMTVEQFKQMKEDKAHRDEIKAIEEEERADEQAAERLNQETTLEGQRMDSEALDDWQQDPPEGGFMPPPPEVPTEPSQTTLEGQRMDSEALSDWHQDQVNPEKHAMDQLDEPGGMLDDLRAETQTGEFADTQLAEDDPAVQEFKELNKKAVAGDKEAEEERAEIFEGMPKEEKAMAKEELGNYYIGPGGYAINLDTLDASAKRLEHMQLLQMLPDHAKPYMLGEWGYIDKEDLKNMPESPEYRTEEMKLIKGLEKTRLEQEGQTKRKGMGVEGSKDVATIQTEASKIMAKGKYDNNIELQKMQDHASQTALKMNLDWQALKQSSVEMIAMDDRELRRHVADMQNVLQIRK